MLAQGQRKEKRRKRKDLVLQSFAEQLTLIEYFNVAFHKTYCFLLDIFLLIHDFVHFLCWPKVRGKRKEERFSQFFTLCLLHFFLPFFVFAQFVKHRRIHLTRTSIHTKQGNHQGCPYMISIINTPFKTGRSQAPPLLGFHK
ncbi:MAG: hypothetical protein CFE24_11175 [Flavobacterium sp. BFFFF2]|nr:MAG: hypothetical protein CFE24_11175 [Flavobacterium sp. BFFFF2]